MSNLVFTESSDDAVWDFEDDATRWVDNCPDLTHAAEMEGAVRGYRAGAAASEARIEALEAALRDALPQLEGCFWQHTWHSEQPREPEYLVNIRALLKEADQ